MRPVHRCRKSTTYWVFCLFSNFGSDWIYTVENEQIRLEGLARSSTSWCQKMIGLQHVILILSWQIEFSEFWRMFQTLPTSDDRHDLKNFIIKRRARMRLCSLRRHTPILSTTTRRMNFKIVFIDRLQSTQKKI